MSDIELVEVWATLDAYELASINRYTLLDGIRKAADEIERLRDKRDEARDAARWFSIVLTNMTQGEQMVGVYERWPWLKEEVGDE